MAARSIKSLVFFVAMCWWSFQETMSYLQPHHNNQTLTPLLSQSETYLTEKTRVEQTNNIYCAHSKRSCTMKLFSSLHINKGKFFGRSTKSLVIERRQIHTP